MIFFIDTRVCKSRHNQYKSVEVEDIVSWFDDMVSQIIVIIVVLTLFTKRNRIE